MNINKQLLKILAVQYSAPQKSYDTGEGNLLEVAAKDIMTSGVITLDADATIQEAVNTFVNEGITAVVVTQKNGEPVGVFTETDLANFQSQQSGIVTTSADDARQLEDLNDEGGEGFHVETFNNETISEWMTPRVVSVQTTDTLDVICATMTRNQIHRVFVQDGDRLVGVISTMDVVAVVGSLGGSQAAGA